MAGAEEINSDAELLAVLSGGKKRVDTIKEEATSLDDPMEPETKDAKPESSKDAAAKPVKVSVCIVKVMKGCPLFVLSSVFRLISFMNRNYISFQSPNFLLF